MDQAVELVPLVCTRCSMPVPAEPEEVAWVCAHCGQGLVLDEQLGLVPQEVNYSAAIAPGAVGKPYWVSEGRVQLRRETYGGGRGKEAEQFWAEPRHFFIPAFALPLEQILSVSSSLLMKPPALAGGPACPFAPAILPPHGVRAAAEFIVMAVEAGRKDKLKEVQVSVQLSPPVLWILP